MTLLDLALIGALVIVLPLVLQEVVARKNARMVDESALAYTGARSRADLVNRRAHVNRDPRFAQNPANTGFIFFYDCRDADLVIEGVLPACKLFHVSVYDRFSMPLPSMVNDDDVRGSDDRYVIFLTTRPRGARNEIDVSANPRGTGIIRYSHMTHPDTIEQYEPTLAAVARDGAPGPGGDRAPARG